MRWYRLNRDYSIFTADDDADYFLNFPAYIGAQCHRWLHSGLNYNLSHVRRKPNVAPVEGQAPSVEPHDQVKLNHMTTVTIQNL